MVEILNTQTKHRVSKRSMGGLLDRLIRHYGLKDPELSLAFVGERTIRRLNREFLKKDRVTDVLSFPIARKGADGLYYLGDIIIAPAQARRQARQKGHGIERELGILVIHGFLHLLGYDHGRGIEEEEARLQKRLLGR
jgi:probable rRNA maturation factor